ECLGNETAYLLIDCTKVGRKCRTLLIGLYYHGTVLPLVWKTLKGKKGHVKGDFQKKLLEEVYSQFRYHKHVVVLGDAEFSNQPVITWCQLVNWDFVFRFQSNYYVYLNAEDIASTAKELGEMVSIVAGEVKQWEKVEFTTAHRMKKLTVTIHWDEDAEEPVYLISTLSADFCPHLIYEKRYAIETLFGNNKSRGFQLNRTHMTTPKHIDRLILAIAIATCITMGIGTHLIVSGQSKLVDRTDRRDLSLFQIGWRWIYRLLALNRMKEMKIEFRFDFKLPPPGFQPAN
ncbi:MAG: transposase, partial [Candidatus Brocadiaceae bacterium]|nr:transposase [Candidatus Brocadiaceae bacterium]